MLYSGDGFKVKGLTDEQVEEFQFLIKLSMRYIYLGFVSLIGAFAVALKYHSTFAFFILLLSNLCFILSAHYRGKARDIFDE